MRGGAVPDYVLLMKLTEEGAHDIAQAPYRIEQAMTLWESMGGRIHSFCLTMGEYDYVAVASGPDDETAAVFALKLSQQGNVKTTSMRAFRDEAMISLFNAAFPDPSPTYPTMHRGVSTPHPD
jgi:uncharacterized protein with GYD domain